MTRVSHQTVRLGRGDHPEQASGMCVLELASVLAGDEFDAYPPSVCPVIAAFLRCYNDLVDNARRQDLIPYAAAVVGTRADKRKEAERARLCRKWVVEVARPGWLDHPSWTLLAFRSWHRHEAAALYAAFVAFEDVCNRHRAALELVERLVGRSAARPEERAVPLRQELEVTA
jgi:hypothetical protein